MQLPPNAETREAVLADARQDLARVPVEQGKIQLRMPDKPGLYTLRFDKSEKIEKIFSVNPSPRESELVYAESGETAKIWQLNNDPSTAGRTSILAPKVNVSLRAILQQRLWWWMVLGGVLALALETVLAEGKRRQI